MNVYVRELVSALAQAGVRSSVYVRRWDDDLPEIVEVEPGFRVVHVPAGPANLAKEHLPEIVSTYTDWVGDHLRAESDTDAIHANYWLSGLAGHRLKHELSLPLVSTFHTLARVKAETGDPEPQRRIDAETDVIGCSDAILASCSAEVEQLVSLYGAARERIEIVPPGVDHAFFAPGDQLGARRALRELRLGSAPVLLFVGRIQPLKGVDVAVRALGELSRTHPDAILVVVGGASGPAGSVAELGARQLVSELGLTDRVRFVEPQAHHALSTYYRAADVCLVPSRSESFGLVALEAAACGTPVIAADVGGLTTLIEHGQTGYLIDSRDPLAYATALTSLLDTHGLREQMGAAAATRASRYTWSTTAARLRRLYSDLTSRSLVECR